MGLLTPRIRGVRIHTQSKIQEKKMIQLNNQALFQTDTFHQMIFWKAYLFEVRYTRKQYLVFMN